jgi:hypothetical protein
MFTILGADGKEYGPVTAGKIHEWIAGGRANLQTKARRAGETEWKTLGDFPEVGEFGTGGAAASTVPPPLPDAPAPGGPTPAAAAATGPLSGTAAESASVLIARAAPLDVFGCLARRFELWKANFWPLVGITLLVLLVQAVAGMVPLLGLFSGLCLNGVFYGGLYYYYLGKIRGQPREVGDAFAGFSKAFVPLMLATLLTSVLVFSVMLVFCGPLFFFVIKAAINNSLGALPALSPLALGGLFVGMIVVVYLSVSWTFAFALIIDQGLSPWVAMETSRRVVTAQWFRVFLLLLTGWILAMLGIIGLIIGVFFTLPLMFGAMLMAYEDLCRPPVA